MAAIQLLQLCNFLSNDVSDELLLHGQPSMKSLGTEHITEDAKEQFDEQKALLLSYSLVKIDGKRHRVWIHPVVHKWAHEQCSGADKRECTQQVSDLIAQASGWSSTKKKAEW